MSSKRLVVVLTVTLLLAGCTGFGGAGDAGAESGAPMDQSAPPQPADSGVAQGRVVASQAGTAGGERAIIRSGRMVVEVSNFSASRTELVAQVQAYGGYVNGSNRQLHRTGDQRWTTGYVVLRVPSERYDDLQADARGTGTVVSERTETTDVTSRLVDIEARLENLRSRRDRLRTFYERANDTEELLAVESELSAVQGDIERLEARQRSLEQRVAYSTLRVELREDAPGPVETNTAFHEQSLLGAFLRSVRSLYVAGRTVLVAGVAAAPWLAAAGLAVIGLRRGLRRVGLPSLRSAGSADSESRPNVGDAESTDEPEDASESGPGDQNLNDNGSAGGER